MQIAIDEAQLPGRTVMAKFEQAAALGAAGVEVQAENLTARVPAYVEAMQATGVKIAAVHMGRRDGYLSPQLSERESAIGALRQAMADAVDLEAGHVLFVPRYGASQMPDLTPYRAPIELDAEMMVWLLRTVSDLAYAMGVELDIMPVNRYESSFINRLQQAVTFRQKIKDHPHVKIAASLSHMLLEESNWQAELRECLPHVGYIQLAEPNGRLPGAGLVDLPALTDILSGYSGWVTLSGAWDTQAEIKTCLEGLQ